MSLNKAVRRFGGAVVVAMALGLLGSQVGALGPGRSFTFLQAGFTQEVVGVASSLLDPEFGILGDVAFAPDGDVWATECAFQNTRLHRFDVQATTAAVNDTPLRPETIVQTQGGCGLTNHPDGTLYSNMNNGVNGIANLNASTGALIRAMGPPGNALGIAVDPIPPHHIFYIAANCRFTATCTIIKLDPVSGAFTNFAVLSGATDAQFIDGIYFDPTGSYLFAANRAFGPRQDINRLTVLNRAGAVVQHVGMLSEPDGVSFKAGSPKFVVTNNTDGTITRFDFPGDNYSGAPTVTTFASGGFRGDLQRVGPDGCVYLTQNATRYNNAAVADNDSVVRICGGFAPDPGVSGRAPATLLVIDEDSIDNGSPPNFFSDVDVNDQIAEIGVRTVLRYFGRNPGQRITLHTGQVGDEGWFALKTIPASWRTAGPTADGAVNFLRAGPGLGSPDRNGDREALLDKIPDVTPLRARGLKMLEGQSICAVVFDSDISINYGPLDGSLKGANLGVVAFRVIRVTQLTGESSSSLPKVDIGIIDAGQGCQAPLRLFLDAPVPISSSEPFDVRP